MLYCSINTVQKLEGGIKLVYRNKALLMCLMVFCIFTLAACSSSSKAPTDLKKGDTYIGKNATSEIINVKSNDSWTIKSKGKDDMNYTVATVTKTDENIGGYPVIELKTKEVKGDIDSRFVKPEGRKYIVIKDGKEVYFRSVSEDNIADIKEKLKNTKDKDAYIEGISNYIFASQ